jgi:hypothetical protein
VSKEGDQQKMNTAEKMEELAKLKAKYGVDGLDKK